MRASLLVALGLAACASSPRPDRPAHTAYELERSIGGPDLLDTPLGVAVDRSGRLVVADTGNGRIQVFAPGGELERTIIGEGEGALVRPMDVAVAHGGSIWVADLGHATLLCFTSEGETCPVHAAAVHGAVGLDVREDGATFVAEPLSSQVRAVRGTARWALGGRGGAAGQLDGPTDVLALADGELLVADADNDRVQVFDAEGRARASWKGPPERPFMRPTGIAEADEIVHVADSGRHRVVALDREGAVLASWSLEPSPSPLDSPARIAAAGDRVYVADAAGDRIVVLRLER